jgi:hypothetical protein
MASIRVGMPVEFVQMFLRVLWGAPATPHRFGGISEMHPRHLYEEGGHLLHVRDPSALAWPPGLLCADVVFVASRF